MYPREAPKKPVMINYTARSQFVVSAFSGFCLLGGLMAYVFTLVSTVGI